MKHNYLEKMKKVPFLQLNVISLVVLYLYNTGQFGWLLLYYFVDSYIEVIKYRKVLNRVQDSIRKLKFKVGFYSNLDCIWDWTLLNWYQNEHKNYTFFNKKCVEIRWFHIILTFLWAATQYLQRYSVVICRAVYTNV